jgi:hypothetical protein
MQRVTTIAAAKSGDASHPNNSSMRDSMAADHAMSAAHTYLASDRVFGSHRAGGENPLPDCLVATVCYWL